MTEPQEPALEDLPVSEFLGRFEMITPLVSLNVPKILLRIAPEYSLVKFWYTWVLGEVQRINPAEFYSPLLLGGFTVFTPMDI